MGTATFERGAVVEIDHEKYCLLRKVSDTCWQLEHAKTARITELEHEQLLRMYADNKLRFVNAVSGIKHGKTQIEISATAKLRRLYVLAALKAGTLTDLQEAIVDTWRQTKKPDKPPGYVSVYRWKKRFVESGFDVRALEDARQKGNPTRRFPSEVLDICRAVYQQRVPEERTEASARRARPRHCQSARREPTASRKYGPAAADEKASDAARQRDSCSRPIRGPARARRGGSTLPLSRRTPCDPRAAGTG